MKPWRAWWVLLAGAMACHHAPPTPSPTPATATRPDTSPVPAAAQDSTPQPDSTNVAPHDVTREALRMFGDTVPTPDTSASVPAEGPTWDIDVRSYETHERVEYYISRFQHEARDHFTVWLQRGGRYERMIRAKLREMGLPEDMTYLALIESGYDPHAYSDAAAVGMWQFMTSTARGMGLRVDWWVDERRDPVRSTDAAARFLAGLNEQFGSLYLAAAAYNGGPGRVARGLTRYADELEGQTGDDVFFALARKDYLHAETKDYVPKLIAAALVAKDPTRYGFTIAYDPELAYDSVRVGPLTPLAAVGKASGTTLARIMELNPQLLRGLTPPRDSFTVRVPVGSAAGFDSSFAALPASDRMAYSRTLTRKGETLASLASRVDVSARQLVWYNPSLKPNKRGKLPVGSLVLIPAPGVLAAARDVPDPAIERYGGTSTRAMHVVKRGESLGSIAKKYRTSVAALKRLNGLKKAVIFPGQVILVKGTPATGRKAAVHARSKTSANDEPATKGKKGARHTSSAARIHVVKRGESLQSIARRYDTSTKALRKLNGLDGSDIRAGQKLVVKE